MAKRFIQALMVFLLACGISACASKGTTAQAELNAIDDAMELAISVGADELAPVELRIAREKQRLANVAMRAKKYTKSQMLSREAKVDAEYAAAFATAMKARQALEGVYNEILTGPEAEIRKTSNSSSNSMRALIGGE